MTTIKVCEMNILHQYLILIILKVIQKVYRFLMVTAVKSNRHIELSCCLLGLAVECATARLSACSQA